jgi:outer membrane biosynthesis protein TonB
VSALLHPDSHNPMSLRPAAIGVDSWGMALEADRRFRRILVRTFAPVIALALIIPMVRLQIEKAAEKPPVVEVIQLLPDPPKPLPLPKPEIKPEEPPVEKAEPKPVPKAEAPKPVVPKKEQPSPAAAAAAPQPSAREIAQQSGLMQFRDQLAAVRSQNAISASTNQPLQVESSITSTTNSTPKGERLAAANGSGGIGSTSGKSVVGSQNGTNLGNRRTASVQSGIGYGTGAPQGNGGTGSGAAASRSLQDLQLAFDRNKSSFFSIFNRAARETPGMESGKIVMSLTIAPDGSVTRCDIVSSSFNDAALEEKIVQRVRLMNFGAKNVPAYTYPNYPMVFIPS